MKWSAGKLIPFALFSLCILVAQQAGSRGDCVERVFSNVRHIAEPDDYVGTELVLAICGDSRDVTASWNEYEGFHPVTTKLRGVRTGRTLRLEGVNSEGIVEFTGELPGRRLKGTLVWYSAKNRQIRTINLVQTTRPVRPPG